MKQDLRKTLRALRLKDNLSQAELAVRMGVHRNTVYRMELHPESAQLSLLSKAALAYDVSLWKILRHAPPDVVQK